MKCKWCLAFFPFILWAQSYFGEFDPALFSAQVVQMPHNLYLDETGVVQIDVRCPNHFQLHSVAHHVDQSSIQWQADYAITEKKEEQDLLLTLKMYFDPKIEGAHYLHLPILHLASKEETKNFCTLYPPMISIKVDDIQAHISALKNKEVLSLDLRRPIEINTENENQYLKQHERHIQEILAKNPNSWPKWIRHWLVIVMAAFGLTQFWRWLKKKIQFTLPFQAKEDPQKVALKDLELLKKQMLVQKGYFEEFYVRLTKIVRIYIERQYHINAPEQTTQEFLKEALLKNLFQKSTSHYLDEFLQFADLVKFARLHPLPNECEQAQDAAEKFIRASYNKASQSRDEKRDDV